jgi:hypothetical protein
MSKEKNKDVNENIQQEEIKRRKSAKNPEVNVFSENLNNIEQSTNNQITHSPTLKFKSTSLFAYQELDKFSSFCDNDSFPLDVLSDLNEKQIQNKRNYNNINNWSTKQEEYEESDSSCESMNDGLMDDDIVLKKHKHRQEKRKSALTSIPSSYSSLKSNDVPNNKMNNFGSGQKPNNNVMLPNNLLTNNYILNNNNNQDNLRRSSYPINSINNNLLFNNILSNNQANSFSQFMSNSYNNNNSMNNNNSFNLNNSGNNYMMNNKLNNSPNQINNYNYMNNFAFNLFNNNIQGPITKKRNSMFSMATSEIQNQIQRRYSHNLIPNFQMMNSDKKLTKLNNFDKEENPNYFLKDQLYCRQIQNKLDNNANNKEYSKEFYENIKPQLIDIIKHQFGNYVIQKFLSILLLQENKVLYKLIFLDIKDKLYEICIHNYGTRVIQKTLEKLDNNNYYKIETKELDEVFQNLIESHLYDLCCDKNGNHVYQKLLRIFPKERNQFLYDSLIKISYPVSIIQQGATLLQTAFDFGSKEQTKKLSNAIINRIGDLINDKHGNYTIQTVFKLYDDKTNDRIFEYIEQNILTLSKEKFSSNVIDKCIIKDYDKSKKLIDIIIEKKIIKEIIIDQYGNYVVQKALNVSDKNICTKIIEQIKPILGEFQKTNIGKKIYEKLNQNYKEYFI